MDGRGDFPLCPLLVSSDVVGAVAAVKGTSAAAADAAAQSGKAWLEEAVDVAAAAGQVVAMAAAADCLEEDVPGGCEEHLDAKAGASSDVGDQGVCETDVEEACCR